MATLFEKIASGEIGAEILQRDDKCFAIRDISPQAPLHLLIIPLEPIESLAKAGDGSENLLGHLLLVGAQMAKKFSFGDDFRAVINCGPMAGQSVPHLHVHILAGRPMAWPPG
ncbi:MAG: HIT domain-containing protein [Puniceicoccales bacterium]|jgi:histidine triad (HIT) family protein|nr:HIT domain-containing protein [Puniceicoccales bacterium]